MSLTNVILLVLVAVVIALIINRKAVGTLWFNIRSAFGAGARTVDKANAVNNMKQTIDDAKSDISRYTGKLNESNGLINSMTRESETSKKEVAVLTVQVHQRAEEVNGNTNDPVLLDLAGKLSKAEIRAHDAAHELEEQVALHNSVLVQVQEAVTTCAQLEEEAESMGVKLDLSASRAELASVGINFQKTGAHGKLAKAEEYKKEIQKQIDANNGAVTTAKQLNVGTGDTTQKTKEWLAAQSAKDTLAKLGIGKKPDLPMAEEVK